MTASYVAWNGESYPWPPPEGWYQASDGRWWAPGAGPDPAGPPGAEDHAPHRTAPSPSPQHQSTGGQAVPQDPTVIAAPPGQVAIPPPGSHDDRQASPPPGRRLGNDPFEGGGWQSPPGRATGDSKVPLLIVGAVVIGVVALGGLFLALRGVGDGDAVATGDAGTTTPPSTEPVSRSTSGPTTPTAEPSTTTTPATTRAPVDTISDAEKVAGFRRVLDERDLDGSTLTDDDIITFGESFCLLAQLAEDMSDFIEIRDETVAETESLLSDDELSRVVDTAILTFCPEEAERLSLT